MRKALSRRLRYSPFLFVLHSQILILCFSLIQGPPGTGKTHTAVFILRKWHEIYPTANIMATADTNTAVRCFLAPQIFESLFPRWTISWRV